MPELSSPFIVQLNGAEVTVEGDNRLSSLLERLRMRRGRIAVEINHVIVPRADYERIDLKPGDTIEIINFVGGG
jgi:sulfur carrier protein